MEEILANIRKIISEEPAPGSAPPVPADRSATFMGLRREATAQAKPAETPKPAQAGIAGSQQPPFGSPEPKGGKGMFGSTGPAPAAGKSAPAAQPRPEAAKPAPAQSQPAPAAPLTRAPMTFDRHEDQLFGRLAEALRGVPASAKNSGKAAASGDVRRREPSSVPKRDFEDLDDLLDDVSQAGSSAKDDIVDVVFEEDVRGPQNPGGVESAAPHMATAAGRNDATVPDIAGAFKKPMMPRSTLPPQNSAAADSAKAEPAKPAGGVQAAGGSTAASSKTGQAVKDDLPADLSIEDPEASAAVKSALGALVAGLAASSSSSAPPSSTAAAKPAGAAPAFMAGAKPAAGMAAQRPVADVKAAAVGQAAAQRPPEPVKAAGPANPAAGKLEPKVKPNEPAKVAANPQRMSAGPDSAVAKPKVAVADVKFALGLRPGSDAAATDASASGFAGGDTNTGRSAAVGDGAKSAMKAAVSQSVGAGGEVVAGSAAAPASDQPSKAGLPQISVGGTGLSIPHATISASGVRTVEDIVAELLRPMLREWLAENMPRMVEKALRIELAEGLKTVRPKPGGKLNEG